MKIALIILAMTLLIVSHIAVAEITAQYTRRQNVGHYADLIFNQQIQCSEKQGELEAQIGYLETLTNRNL